MTTKDTFLSCHVNRAAANTPIPQRPALLEDEEERKMYISMPEGCWQAVELAGNVTLVFLLTVLLEEVHAELRASQ